MSLQTKIFLLIAEIIVCVQLVTYVAINDSHQQFANSLVSKDIKVAVTGFEKILENEYLDENSLLKRASEIQKQHGVHILLFDAKTGKRTYGLWPSSAVYAKEELYNVSLYSRSQKHSALVEVNEQAWAAETFLFMLPGQEPTKALFFQQTKYVLSPLQTLKANLRNILFFGMGLAFFISFFLVRYFTNPISQLKNQAKRISNGNYNTKINVQGKGDIGQLAQSFATMKKVLVQHIQENKAANEVLEQQNHKLKDLNNKVERKLGETEILLSISQAMSMRLQGQSVMEIALTQVKNFFDAEMTAIFSYDKEKCEFFLKNTNGSVFPIKKDEGERKNAKTILDLISPLLIRLLQMKQPIVVNDFLPTNLGVIGHSKKTLNTSLFPLKKNNEIVGALGIFHLDGVRKMEEQDIQFLLTVASNLTVLLENEYLHEENNRDNLTQLNNRAYFYSQLKKGMLLNPTTEMPMTLFMFDIDNFKMFNDKYGHLVGDAILRQMGHILKKILRKDEDVLCRVGGEEFGIVLNGAKQERLDEIAERMRSSIEAFPFQHEGQEYQVTVSIGYACYPTHAEKIEGLIEAADQAMYVSKYNGRNQATKYNPVVMNIQAKAS